MSCVPDDMRTTANESFCHKSNARTKGLNHCNTFLCKIQGSGQSVDKGGCSVWSVVYNLIIFTATLSYVRFKALGRE